LGGVFDGEFRVGEEEHGFERSAFAGRMAGCVLAASQKYLS
jgi:hypothetical protein